MILPDVGSTVRWATHGYPVAAARWHHQPEIEFHLITATSGQMMVGNRTLDFALGEVSLMGPHLLYNWMSDLAPAESVGLLGRMGGRTGLGRLAVPLEQAEVFLRALSSEGSRLSASGTFRAWTTSPRNGSTPSWTTSSRNPGGSSR